MLNSLIYFDQNVSDFLSGIIPHNAVTDAFFSFLSLQGLTFLVWLVFLALYLLIQEKKDKQFIMYLLLSFATTSFLVNIVFKNIVRRERPYVAQNLSEVTCPVDFSFPSGHAAGAFAGAVVFAQFDKKRKGLYYIVAIMISYSRIYLLCHYFADVLFGALIGYSIGKTYLKVLAGRIKI